MYHQEDQYHRSFRATRATLSALCHAVTATTILDRNHPIAILVPIEESGYDRYTTKDKRNAKTKKLFDDAIKRLRTQ